MSKSSTAPPNVTSNVTTWPREAPQLTAVPQHPLRVGLPALVAKAQQAEGTVEAGVGLLAAVNVVGSVERLCTNVGS